MRIEQRVTQRKHSAGRRQVLGDVEALEQACLAPEFCIAHRPWRVKAECDQRAGIRKRAFRLGGTKATVDPLPYAPGNSKAFTAKDLPRQSSAQMVLRPE